MKNTNVIYQCFDNGKTCFGFPYPPVYIENNTDYICFATDKSVVSSSWAVIYVDEYKDEVIAPYLEEYKNSIKVETNQIQVAPFFKNGAVCRACFITAPDSYDLPEVSFDKDKLITTSGTDGKYAYRKNSAYTGGMYEGRDILLTIGVPVSNQIETIDRCLSHIKPLLDAVDSELVVVDTGSTDGTIDVCRSYGARIIEFPWCDNMSAARNVALNNARGLWYMSIDDDEWFEDVSEVIDFFCRGIYKNYDMASYKQRNYSSIGGTEYTDYNALRMARIYQDTHFEGRIHDAIINPNMESRAYSIDSYAHHYGFARDDNKKIMDKYRRNVGMLLYDVYEYPNELRYNWQLANELEVNGYYKEAAAYYWKGIAAAIELKDKDRLNSHAFHLLRLEVRERQEKFFEDRKLLCGIVSFQCVEKAWLCSWGITMGADFKHPSEEIAGLYEEYEKNRKEYEKLPKSRFLNITADMRVYCQENLNLIRGIAFAAYAELGRYYDAIPLLRRVNVLDVRFLTKRFYECLYIDMRYLKTAIEQLTSMEINSVAAALMSGFVDYTLREDVNKCDLDKCIQLLSCFNIKSIQRVIDDSEHLTYDEFWNKAGSAENIQIMENMPAIPIQTRYFFMCILKRRHLLGVEKPTVNMDVFLKYVHVTSDFAKAYYSPALLEDEKSEAVEADIRASILVWSACGEQNILQMVRKLKKALEICPIFHREIKVLLQVVNVTV